jgi:hypothetical protein
MYHMVSALIMLGQIMNLRMAVMTWRYAVRSTCLLDLLILQFSVSPSCFGIARLEKSAAPSATVIVRHVRSHIDKILFTDNSFYDKPQILGNRVAKSFADQLAWILNSEFYLQFLVPVGIYLKLSLSYPLGIILNNALNLKIVGYVEFFQSGPDCKEFVPSLSIEPDFAFQIIHSLSLDLDYMLP